MLKRLPYIFLAVAIAVYFSAQGFTVSAASPNFYSGSCEFGIGRRSFYDTVDFNYYVQDYSVPFLGDVGIIDSNAWGLPAAFSETTYTTVPAYFAINCPDVVRNGGHVYFSFMFAYWNGNGVSNVQLSNGRRGHAYLSQPGSFDYAIANGIDLGTPALGTTVNPSNTALINPTPAATGNEVIHVTELNMPSGVNFPKVALFDLDDDKGTLNAYGLSDAYILGYGETAEDTWIKGYVWTFRIDLDPRSGYNSNGNQTCIYVDLHDCFRGSFTPVAFNNYNLQTNAGIYFIQSTLSGSMCNLVYMCPVACFAISDSSYLDIEEYLANIDNKISALAGLGGDYPQSVLESYVALGSEAREAAHAAASQMAQNYPTYDPSAMDISNYVNPTAKAQFKSVVSFLSNRRILPIIGVVFTLVLIGYVFFGKK